MNKQTVKPQRTFFFVSAMAQMSALAAAITPTERSIILSTPVRKKSRIGASRPSGVAKAKRAARKARNKARMK